MIKTVILDFDGVILESVDVKTEVFRSLFSFAPDHIDEIVNYHLENGGISRFDKFRYIYSEILNQNLSTEQFNYLSESFAREVREKVLNSSFVEGALSFLKDFHQQFPIFIVSATPEVELVSIINARGIREYFKDICGAPNKKDQCIRRILKENEILPEFAVFVGDSPNDFDAARETGVHFIGRIRPGDCNRFIGHDVELIISNLSDLSDLVHGGVL